MNNIVYYWIKCCLFSS